MKSTTPFNGVGGLAILVSVLVLIVTGCTGTPPISDDDGQPREGSIASLETVTWQGDEFYLLLRGHDRTAPVLLWLAGGPGGSELGWTRTALGDLERDVVFVNWDQPGVAGAFNTVDWQSVTVDDYVDATIALSEYLCNRFGKDRIILAGHSWGSIIGLKAVHRRPDLYHTYLAVAQQVNSRENDLHGYNLVMKEARRRGDTRVVRKLKEFGPPPYSREEGNNYVYLFQKVHVYSAGPGNANPSLGSMLFPREYTLLDSINTLRGVIHGVSNIYPQLKDLDFELQVPAVDVPVYFFTGRYDETCVQDIEVFP